MLNAIDTPGLACSSAATLGTDNCLITVASGDEGPSFRYIYAHVNTTTGIVVPDTTQYNTGIYVYQTPYVSPNVGNDAYPFSVALRQGGAEIYFFRKPASKSASFQNQSSYTPSPMGTTPSVGFFKSWTESYYSAPYLVTYD